MRPETFFESYLHHQRDFRSKWIHFYHAPKNFDQSHYIPELTPFYGTAEFELLTQNERERFFFEYIKLLAEALVFFEQILVFGGYQILKKKLVKDPEAQKALHQLINDELFHSYGFRHFLAGHEIFHWDQKKIYADSKLLRKIVTGIVHFAPSCVFLSGAKLEAFTLSYFKLIKKYYPENRENAWIHLNHIHQLDEALHVPLDFDLHDSIINDVGPLKTMFASLFFILSMQMALVIGAYKVIHYGFPHKNFLKKCGLVFKMARWAVRGSPAYNEARVLTKKYFQKKKPKWGNLISFIYW